MKGHVSSGRGRARGLLNVSQTTLPPPFDILRDGKSNAGVFYLPESREFEGLLFAVANGDSICARNSPVISAQCSPKRIEINRVRPIRVHL